MADGGAGLLEAGAARTLRISQSMQESNNLRPAVPANMKWQWASMPNLSFALGLVVLVVATNACGASNPGQRSGGAPALARALPAPTPSPFGLTYGQRHPGMSGELRGFSADRGPALQRAAAREAVALQSSSPRPARAEKAGPSLRAFRSVAPVQAPVPVDTIDANAVAVQRATERQPSVVSDSERYAQRQNKSRNLERYRGGDVVVIGASTLVIVLLIVLLIILLL
jgi:hypothetical protein